MSLRVITTPIAGSPLTHAAIGGVRPEWFVTRPGSAGQWRERADVIRGSLITPDWLDALGPALRAGGLAAERLERAASGGIVVTAGQQPGLFGGPLYTWWKALTALALADRLQELTGISVAPVFWAATDDSDFAEAAGTVVATAEGAERIEMPTPVVAGPSLAETPLGDLREQLALLTSAAGSAPNREILELLRHAYVPDQTIGGAYVELLRGALERLGVSVLDAAHPAVRVAAHPLLLQALAQAESLETALTERSRAVKAAGLAIQVKLVKGRTLVFRENGGKRERIRTAKAQEAAAAARPGSLGPNVLLRPVVERSILPTVAYVGGPAEMAYFAQVTAVAAALEVPAPLVVPRWSGVVVEPRIQKILERHGLEPEDFSDPHAVETRIARDSVPPPLKESITGLKASIDKAAAEVEESGGGELLTPGVIHGLRRNVAHRVERLERRVAAKVKRRGNDALRDAAIARGALYPLGLPQERALNFVPLFARYGADLMAAVQEETRQHAEKLA